MIHEILITIFYFILGFIAGVIFCENKFKKLKEELDKVLEKPKNKPRPRK